MSTRLFFPSYKLPSLTVSAAIIVVSLFLALFIQGCLRTAVAHSQAASAAEPAVYSSESQNIVIASLDEAAHTIGQDLNRAAYVAGGGLRHASAVTAAQSKKAAAGGQALLAAIGRGASAAAHSVANGFVFAMRIPGNIFGFISDSRLAGAIIAPSEHSHNNEVPIIDPNDPALFAAQKALPAIEPQKQADTPAGPQEVVWPMQGAITTYFGEKGRYYHPVHTGIDISDGKRPGVTQIKAYRSGIVHATGRDGGLGNRVVVDHGNGVSSVYGHLSSITVAAGQKVDTSTTLGFEGSTGVSTGTHLHFEIRINGQVANPLLFIAGRP